jgi:hypothetical protein
VRVLEVGRGLRFNLEPLSLLRFERGGERQDLEGHAPPQRDLLGLINDAHASAAQDADDSEISQTSGLTEHLFLAALLGCIARSQGADDQLQPAQALTQVFRDLRVEFHKGSAIGGATPTYQFKVLVEGLN